MHACPSCTACLLPAAIFAKRTQGTYAPQDCTTRGTGNAGIAPAVAGRCAIHQAAKRALRMHRQVYQVPGGLGFHF